MLEVRNLCVDYLAGKGTKRAVDRVSFTIETGEVLGLAGESGSGKSTIAQAILRILRPPGVVSSGQVLWNDVDVLAMSPAELRRFRWAEIAMVFQSAMSSLNPVMTIGDQIADTLQAHGVRARAQVSARIAELLELVGIDHARASSYPHQLSGGMRQRAVIAISLALNPQLLIMDEPTTALDVVVQRSIMERIRELRSQLGFSILFITHDLSLLGEFSDRIAIMYAGEIIELGEAKDVLTVPQHPYTTGLVSSFPTVTGPRERLVGIPGSPPDLLALPTGCRFHPRCARAFEPCTVAKPALLPTADRVVACHLHNEVPR